MKIVTFILFIWITLNALRQDEIGDLYLCFLIFLYFLSYQTI